MSNIEEDKERLMKSLNYELDKLITSKAETATAVVILKQPITCMFLNLLLKREQDKNKIKELENKYIIHLTDEQYRKLVDTIRKEEKEKLKQKIKDKKREIQKIGQYLYTNINVRNILEELLEDK